MAKNWAIVIGINDYDFMDDLKWADRDAQLMTEFLENKNFSGEETFKVWNFSRQAQDNKMKPTRSKIRHFLNQLKEQKMDKEDNFWFFFSGHGWVENGQDYLMPSDGNHEDLKETAISTKFIIDRLRDSHAGNIYLFLDACRTTGQESRTKGQKKGLGIGDATIIEAKAKKIITFFSCSPSEASHEIDAIRQSSFTRALLEGLRDRVNCTNLEQLESYVKNRVMELNAKYSTLEQNPQTPYIVIETIAEVSKSSVSLLPTIDHNQTARVPSFSRNNKRIFTISALAIAIFLGFSFAFLVKLYKENDDMKKIFCKVNNLPDDSKQYCPQKGSSQSTSFECIISQQGIPTTVAILPNGTRREFIRWINDAIGYNHHPRCKEVTKRLNSSIKSGSAYITHGIINGQPVICTTNKTGDKCQDVLFTISSDQDPQKVLEDLFGLSDRNFSGKPLKF